MELRQAALDALMTPQAADKCLALRHVQSALSTLSINSRILLTPPDGLPGRPARPALVPPASVPQRSVATADGLARLLHAICHIEFNAMNLALDAVWRFAQMPARFYLDWLQVAVEEAYHFEILHRQLRAMGHDYGDFDAHDGLWEMCLRTRDDVLARMALVPRTLEARGLDATPQIQKRLRQAGSNDACAIADLLDIILRDEIGHVAIGNQWYRWLCDQSRVDPVAHYRELSRTYRAPSLRPPINEAARRAAGFSDQELDYLTGRSDT